MDREEILQILSTEDHESYCSAWSEGLTCCLEHLLPDADRTSDRMTLSSSEWYLKKLNERS